MYIYIYIFRHIYTPETVCNFSNFVLSIKIIDPKMRVGATIISQ